VAELLLALVEAGIGSSRRPGKSGSAPRAWFDKLTTNGILSKRATREVSDWLRNKFFDNF